MKIGIGELQDAIQKNFSKCDEVVKWLTANPEISGEEEQACAYLTAFLHDQGYQVQTPYVGVKHSFLASKPESGKPKVAVMCEYDALKNLGHACGHSVSCGISLLAAFAVMDSFDDFPFQLDLMGTPAEELGGGKILIADKGGFDGYDFAIMAHMFSYNAPYFNVLASTDMQVTFYGKSSHASTDPWEGKNALNGTQLFYHAIDMMRQHVTPDVQMHGIISDGGNMPSIVPNKSVSYWYPRAGTLKGLRDLWERMENCAKGVAMATETTCKVEMLYNEYAELYCGPAALEMIQDVMDDCGMDHEVMERPLGSTDAGNVDVRIPTFHPMIAIGDDREIKLHSVEFAELVDSQEAEKSLIKGAEVIALIIARMAYEDGLRDAVKKEHANYRHD